MSAKNLSEVFRDTQKYLWNGSSDFNDGNCEYIFHAMRYVDADTSLIITARKVVTVALSPEYTFDGWLILQGVDHTELIDDTHVQAHRLQWLKMLEAQFKED
jgi:hypothetical protein